MSEAAQKPHSMQDDFLTVRAVLATCYLGHPDDEGMVALERIEEQLEAAKEDRDRCGRMLLDVEGSILAYWTDISEAECERLRVTIRHVLETLPSFEADLAAANSNPASVPLDTAAANQGIAGFPGNPPPDPAKERP